MHILKKALISISALAGVASTAHAADVWFTSTLAYVYPQGDGGFVLVFNDASPDCLHASQYHYVRVNQNGVTEEGKRMMYAAALSAKVSGSRLTIFFDPASGSCYVSKLRMLD